MDAPLPPPENPLPPMSDRHPERLMPPEEAEIGLEDVLNALRVSWRWILSGLVLTPIFVLGGIQGLGKFSAEATLSNTCISQAPEEKEKEKASECALTFARWRMLAENLPGVAGQWAVQMEGRGENPRPLAWLASPTWWEKQVTPVYGISQAETKKFPLMDEKLKAESTRITQLKVTTTDRKQQRAEEGLDWSLRFLRDGATWLELKNLLDGYQSEVAVLSSGFSGERIQAEVEAGYLQSRLKEFETIMDKDRDVTTHDEARVNVGTVEPRYLPLRTQANALKVTLYGLEEKLRRLKDREEATSVLAEFLAQAKPRLGDQYQGQGGDGLARELLEVVDGLSGTMPSEALSKRETVARIRGDVARIQGRYRVQLTELARRVDPPKAALSVLAASAFGGAFLGFILAFGRHKLREYSFADKRI